MEDTKIKNANPAPLGLLGFGTTTVLLNLHNAAVIELSIVEVAMGFALGGLAQFVAGIFEFKQGSTFGGTAFVAYSCFWWSLIIIWLNPGDKMPAADGTSMGYYLLLWGVFSLSMFVGTLRQNRAMQFIFLTLTILFFGLSAGHFSGSALVVQISGVLGIFCGASAIYTAIAQELKSVYGRELLPLCEPKEK